MPWMGAGRRTETFMLNEFIPSSSNQATNGVSSRNLRKSHLGGVIFGCKNNTIKECLVKQLFGLPAQHFAFVENIDPGLPLFLFNYSDRKLHGIFEAASSGKMNINPYAWTKDGSERTLYPAQVQIRVKLQCEALPESRFKPIIMDNYYSQNHFWFELDHAQTSKLLSLLSSLAVAPGTIPPQNTTKWAAIIRGSPSSNRREESEGFEPRAFEADFADSFKSNGKLGTSDISLSPDGNNQPVEARLGNKAAEEEKDRIYMKLKELALSRECSDSTVTRHVEETAIMNNGNLRQEGFLPAMLDEKNGKNEESRVDSSDNPVVIAQLIQGMEELKAFKTEQIHKMSFLEQKLAEAETEIQQLKDKCIMLESMSNPSLAHADETVVESFDEIHLDLDELIFLVGGYDGQSWSSALDSYTPSQDAIKSLKAMNFGQSYASVANLNGELYVCGGGNGSFFYDIVESYNPANNHWTLCPPLNAKKGSLAGAAVNDKIFVMGGGNGSEWFSDVEMFDIDVGRWIFTRSMLQKRFALAAAELNGAIYAIGGYDGKDYLTSAERFDPREHSWTKIESMNTKRGCHSLAVVNEKLYAMGGYDGSAMVPSTEIFDPRLGTWMPGEPMNQSRGCAAAVVLKGSIYVIGGIKGDREDILDTVECYEEGQGWQVTNLRAIGKRSFFSAIVL